MKCYHAWWCGMFVLSMVGITYNSVLYDTWNNWFSARIRLQIYRCIQKGWAKLLLCCHGYNCHSYRKVRVTCSSYKITFRDHRVRCDFCNSSQLKPVAVTCCVAVDFSYLFHIIVLKFSPSPSWYNLCSIQCESVAILLLSGGWNWMLF
jgi:hypothetical protein